MEPTQLLQIGLEWKLADLRKPQIERKLELHLLKCWSKFNSSSIHAQIRIHSDKHENGKDSHTKIADDYCDQARNQLGTPGEAKSFLRGQNISNYVQ